MSAGATRRGLRSATHLVASRATALEPESPVSDGGVGTLPSPNRHPCHHVFIHRSGSYPPDSTVTGFGLYRPDSLLSQGLCRHILIAKPSTFSTTPDGRV